MPESPLLIIRTVESRPLPVGQEKRCDGGSARTQVFACQVSAFGGNPADGAWLDSRRAPARGLRRRAAEPQPVFESVQFLPTRSLGAASAAARRGRPGQAGGGGPAGVGARGWPAVPADADKCR